MEAKSMKGDSNTSVLIELIDDKLKKHKKGDYLIQNYSKGKKTYEKSLKYLPLTWDCRYELLVFKVDPREENGEYFTYAIFHNTGKQLKLKDYEENLSFKTVQAYGSDWLIYANEDTIYEFRVEELEKDKAIDFDQLVVPKRQVFELHLPKSAGIKVWGYRNNQYVIESHENELIFCSPQYNWNDSQGKVNELTFPRNFPEQITSYKDNDPIINLQSYVYNFTFDVAIKHSKNIDIYLNSEKAFSSEGFANFKNQFSDIRFAENYLYLKTLDDQVFQINLNDKKIELKDPITPYSRAQNLWRQALQEKMKYNVRVIEDYLVTPDHLIISLGNIIYYYDLFEISHQRRQCIELPFDVKQILMTYEDEQNPEENKTEWLHELDGMSKGNSSLSQKDLIICLLIEEAYASDETVKSKKTEATDTEILISQQPIVDKIVYINKQGYILKKYAFEGKIKSQVRKTWFQKVSYYYSYLFLDQDKDKKYRLYQLSQLSNHKLVDRTEDFSMLSDCDEISLVPYQIRVPHQLGACLINVAKKKFQILRFNSEYQYQCEKGELESLENFPESINSIKLLVTSLYNKAQYLVLTEENLYVMYNNGEFEKKIPFRSYSRHQYQIIKGKYLYFTDNQGLKVHNLHTLVNKKPQNPNYQGFSIFINKTFLSSNYTQSLPFFERLAYLKDNQCLIIQIYPHKNQLLPFGIQTLSNKFRGKKIIGTKIIPTSEYEYEKIIGIDEAFNLIEWQFPNGKLIKFKPALQNFLSDKDIQYQKTDLFRRKDLILMQKRLDSETKKSDLEGNQNNKTGQASNILNGVLHEMKIVNIDNNKSISLVLKFKFNIFMNQEEYMDYFHFSDDLQYMLQVHYQQNENAFFELKQREDGIERDCVKIRVISNFPFDCYKLCPEINFLFSPDLQHFIDYDIQDSVFKIYKTVSENEADQICLEGLFDPYQLNQDSQKVFRQIAWETNDMLKIINYFDIEKILKIDFENKSVQELSQAYVSMKNLAANQMQYYSHPFFPISRTFIRLLNYYQQSQSIKHQGLQPRKKEFDLRFGTNHIYIESTYTYYHWRLTVQMVKVNREYIIDQLGPWEMKCLLLNVFPFTGDSFFHVVLDLYKRNEIRKEKFDEGKMDKKISFNSAILKAMFKALYDDQNQEFVFPFIKNIKGETPFDVCINTNVQAVDQFLKYLKYHPALTHSTDLIEVLPDLISLELPSINEYLDSRLFKTQLSDTVNTCHKFKPIKEKNYQIKREFVWPHVQEFQDKFKEPEQEENNRLKNKQFSQKNNLETDVELKFLDIPYLHSSGVGKNQISSRFFKAISEVQEYELFKSQSIQFLIDYNWKSTQKFTVTFLFLPFIIYFIGFIIYSNIYIDSFKVDYEAAQNGLLFLSALLYSFTLYFLIHEIGQLFQNKIDYFTSNFIWNFMDLLPNFLIIIVVTTRLQTHFWGEGYGDASILNTIHALASLLMWLKFFYFLRLFEATGYLIRIIMNMLVDMRVFISILFIVQIGFGEAFLRLSNKSEGEGNFLENIADAFVYAFRLSLGDNNVDPFKEISQPVTAWILFVCCEVLTNIVMLNLLITIIGQSFERINQNSRLANFKERAQLIQENMYLVNFCRKCKQDRTSNVRDYLLIITSTVNQGLTEQKDQFQELVKSIKKLSNEMAELQMQRFDKVIDNIEKIEKKFTEGQIKIESRIEEQYKEMSSSIQKLTGEKVIARRATVLNR